MSTERTSLLGQASHGSSNHLNGGDRKTKHPDWAVADEETSPEKQLPLLPFLGTLSAIGNACGLTFTVFLLLKLMEIIHWNYWWTFLPIWTLLLLLLLVLAVQPRKLARRLPMLGRAVWLLSLLCFACFTVFLVLKLEHYSGFHFDVLAAENDDDTLSWSHVFIPLWALFSLTGLFSVGSILYACCRVQDVTKRGRLLVPAFLFLAFVVIFLPFSLMLLAKIDYITGSVSLSSLSSSSRFSSSTALNPVSSSSSFVFLASSNNSHLSTSLPPAISGDISWGVIFIPLFLLDAGAILFSSALLFFTCGSRDSAVFSIAQLLEFLLAIITGIVSTGLLVSLLDGSDLPLWAPSVPLIAGQVILLLCGIQVRIRSTKSRHSSTSIQR